MRLICEIVRRIEGLQIRLVVPKRYLRNTHCMSHPLLTSYFIHRRRIEGITIYERYAKLTKRSLSYALKHISS